MPSTSLFRGLGYLIVLSCLVPDPAPSAAQPADQVPNPRVLTFHSSDRDHDGVLTLDEYLKGTVGELPKLRRDFKVFDSDVDGQLTVVEFLSIPAGQPDDQREPVADPVILLAEARLAELARQWKTWDENRDEQLFPTEFTAAALPSRVPGLELTRFEDWDLNSDGLISLAEVVRVLDIACGVRIPNGESLRSKTGQVVDWKMFRTLNADSRGMISREEYFRVLGPTVQDREVWLQSIDKNQDGQFDFAEFATGNHRTNPVATFLQLDTDFSGGLSVVELAALPNGWRQMADHAFRGFDDNADGTISLREYQLMPHSNLLAAWDAAVDTNRDGVLGADEFRFLPGLPLAALSAHYFRRLDRNRDNTLSLDEWGFHTTNPEARFRQLDKDSDGQLTSAEFTDEESLPVKRLRRDFQVLDTDADERMSLAEFLTVPGLIPEDRRGPIPDPVVLLAEAAWKKVTDRWSESDRDASGALNVAEFETAAIGQQVKGLESTTFDDWDRNRDRKVTCEEIREVLEIAFGVRTPEGEMLRSSSGRVVDWRLFRSRKTDRDGFVSREDYYQALGSLEDRVKQNWFKTVDKNRDGKFNYAEFATSDHRTDPVASFLALDVDLNGTLSSEEFEGLTPDQLAVAHYLFPGFDDDKDGSLSLREYQLTPLVNLLALWHGAIDKNNDGELDIDEFHFHPGIALAALTSEYFSRLDTNQNQSLSLDEFPFLTSHVSANETEIYAVFPNGSTMIIAIPNFPIICSPEISPDNKWVAVDGWNQRQSNVDAHLLVASLESDEVQDLGIGCIPHWSADGHRIAFSKYNGGVFIRDFDTGADKEELIDREGWAIHFSTDGQKVAYVNSGNLVVLDLNTRQRRTIFPAGESPYTYIEHNFTWSPDSQRICFKGHRRDQNLDVGIVSVTGPDPKLRVRCNAKDVQSDFAWLREGNRVMFPKIPSAGAFTQIYEFDADGEQPAVRYSGQPKNRHNGGLCWARDGKTLVFMSKK